MDLQREESVSNEILMITAGLPGSSTILKNKYTTILEEILLSKCKKHVETSVYHSINIQDMFLEGIKELKINSPSDEDGLNAEDAELLAKFVGLQKVLIKYTLEMQKIFSWYSFMSEENLKKYQSRAHQTVTSSEKDNSLLLWTICEYEKVYSRINNEIIQCENDIFETIAVPIALNWYENDFLTDYGIPRAEKHELLKKTCKEAITNILSYSDNHIDIMKSQFDALDFQLDQLYKKRTSSIPKPLRKSRIQVTPPEIEKDSAVPKLAIEFSCSGIKCGIMVNGKLDIFHNPEENDNPYFPICVEFRTENHIKFMQNYRVVNSFKTYCNLENPSNIIHQNSSLKFPNGEVNIREELVCALALEKVKTHVEGILKRVVEHVAITIPLRYTSSKRRSIKDAAEIAGFKNINLITETTAAALAYFKNPNKFAADPRKPVLVLVHTKQHYDAAVYSHQNGVLEMLTCAGNCHNHKRKDEQIEKHIVRKFKKITVGAMIYSGEDQNTSLSISQQIPCKLESAKDAVLLGAAIFSQMDSKNSIINDLHPYKIKLKDSSLSATKTTLFKLPRRSNCKITKHVSLKPKQMKTSESKATKTISGFEKGVSKLSMGIFSINLKGYSNILCTLDQEGLFSILHNNVFIANQFGLQAKDKESFSTFLMYKRKNEELRTVAEYLLKTSVYITNDFVREEIQTEVAASLEFLKQGSSSHELYDRKIEFLKELRAKYAPSPP